MSDPSRRNVLRTASPGAVTLGAATVLSFGSDAGASRIIHSGNSHERAFVVRVADPAIGDVVVLAGETEMSHRDPRLGAVPAQSVTS
jgi:hypothetical protein